MGLFDWFDKNGTEEIKFKEERIVVKTGKSKGPTSEVVSLTVGDIRRGKVTDTTGYVSDVVLFLRKAK